MYKRQVLALYTLIGDNQNEENPVTIGTVRGMMDEAIKRASKKGRRPGKRVGKRHLDAVSYTHLLAKGNGFAYGGSGKRVPTGMGKLDGEAEKV